MADRVKPAGAPLTEAGRRRLMRELLAALRAGCRVTLEESPVYGGRPLRRKGTDYRIEVRLPKGG